MKITFDQSFKKDLEKLPEKKYFSAALNYINIVENAKDFSEIPDCKKYEGTRIITGLKWEITGLKWEISESGLNFNHQIS